MERYTEVHAGVPVLKDKTKMKEAMARLHELEELATPKKVKMTAGNQYVFSKVGHCPNCGETVRGNMKHCDYCGAEACVGGIRMDLDKFGEIMDEFLKKEEVVMLVKLPKGTLDAEIDDNIGAGSVMQFYFLLQAFESVGKQMKKDMELTDQDAWKGVVDNLTETLKLNLLEVE